MLYTTQFHFNHYPILGELKEGSFMNRENIWGATARPAPWRRRACSKKLNKVNDKDVSIARMQIW